MKKIITDINNNIYLKEETYKQNNIDSNNNIIINKNVVIGKWLGLGSAITESAAYNYSKLDKKLKIQLISDLYSKNKLNLNFARLPIGSCDFSLDSYSYAYNNNLSDFSINEDKKYIIPMLKEIYDYKKIQLISSPWSPPAFMKNNKSLTCGGKLKKNYYSLYAKYLRLYIDAYKHEGFDINYITMQNEPYAKQKWESCVYSLKEQYDFMNNYLIKELDGIKTNIILWDHNREKINKYINDLYIDNNKVKGIGLHWYSGPYYQNILDIHNRYPNLLIFNTEMCCGYSKYNNINWINDAELYLKDIISCMNNGVVAYLDWNVLLNSEGGPSHIKNPVKSILVLNEEENNYIKTPIYYYLMHISKYIDKDYEIIETVNNTDLYIVSAKKRKKTIITILNTSNDNINFKIEIDYNIINDCINTHSIITFEI